MTRLEIGLIVGVVLLLLGIGGLAWWHADTVRLAKREALAAVQQARDDQKAADDVTLTGVRGIYENELEAIRTANATVPPSAHPIRLCQYAGNVLPGAAAAADSDHAGATAAADVHEVPRGDRAGPDIGPILHAAFELADTLAARERANIALAASRNH